MRVLFIYSVPEPTKKIYTGYSVGVGSLAAVVKAAGHVPALYIAERFDPGALGSHVQRSDPGCVAISVTSPQIPLAREIIETLRDETTLPVIVGGVGVTVAPGELFCFPNGRARAAGGACPSGGWG